jgi:hypothetical protein
MEILNCIPVGVGRSYAHRHKMCTLYVMFSPIFNSVLFDIYFVVEFIFYSVNILDCHVRVPTGFWLGGCIPKLGPPSIPGPPKKFFSGKQKLKPNQAAQK